MAKRTRKQTNESDDHIIELDNLDEVAYLITAGFPTDSAYWNMNTSRVAFMFPNEDIIRAHIEKYRNNEASVDPKEYMRNYVQAKRLMFGLRRTT